MNKIILFSTLFCAMLTQSVSAQVTIPDANFRAKMKLVAPSCFGANDVLDTVCAAGANVDSLYVSNAQIASIEGVWYFKKLKGLRCDNNAITTIPKLPPLLGELNCANNNLTSSVIIPNSIKYFDCSANQLSSLPVLPSSLISLRCNNNQLTSLPILSNILRYLYCSNNQFTSLPTLPNTLTYLDCRYNQLTTLPALPAAMFVVSFQWQRGLEVSHNQLTSLPAQLPNMWSFDCSFNQLTSLPEGITSGTINCSNNLLTSLPALPVELYSLDCSNNPNLNCLPILPSTVSSINVAGTGITCLPNKPYGLLSSALPYCITAGSNPNSCATTPIPVPFYVTIPDVKLRAALKSQFPLCFNASDQLDTARAAIAPASYMYLSGKQISNLQGIQYFKKINSLNFSSNQVTNAGLVLPKNLTSLECDNNQLSSLGTLPVGLTTLTCSFNQITIFGTLPIGLISLICNNNQITSLGTLPSGLTSLTCNNNQLGSLGTLPIGLNELNCSNNPLGSLGSLPTSLTSLTCNSNQLSSLGTLPTGLTTLECMNNQLGSLGTLPSGLTLLYSSGNPLSSFPSVLPVGLRELKCASNGISVLPSLPNSLRRLECNNNQISVIPELPTGLYTLYCQNNATLACLPVLPEYLYQLNISGTAIGCLPNKPQSISSNTTPLCNTTNNPNQCVVLARMSGYVFNDLNNNGVKEANETPRVGVRVSIPTKNYGAFTDNEGFYEIAFNELGTYTAAIQLPLYYSIAQATPSVTFTVAGQQITQNFPVTAQANVKDFRINGYSEMVRPGFDTRLHLFYENVGTIAGNAVIKLKIPTGYTITSSSESYSTVNGDLVFNLGNVPAGLSEQIIMNGIMPASTPLGTVLTFISVINEGDVNEITPTNNADTTRRTVVGSYDPNDKQGPASITPTQLAGGRYLDYIVRFQNTGTYYAQNVVVIDTLIGLQANTLELIASSHNVKATVRNNIARFEYLNIWLPDSNMNEAASHGFVKFRIKPTTNYLLGDTIKNKAAIYFDFNEPIITNTVNTVVAIPTSIAEKVSRRLEVYPNPLEGETLYISDAKGGSARLLSLEGRELRTWTEVENSVSLRGIAQGLYLLELTDKGQRRVAKVVVK